MDSTAMESSIWASFLSQVDITTSPSQLQEVTLDPNATANGTIPFTVGLRSPGKTSPVRGRTMKEYEEQLSQLKKENFNLKLRIYFLEERMGHMDGQDDKEDPIKKNIELKVEAESLRKEVSDKQELLCQAAKAMDLIEDQHRGEIKKIQQEKDLEKEMMEYRIKELEDELKDFASKSKERLFTNGGDNVNRVTESASETSSCVDHHSHEEVEKLQQQIEDLETQVQQLETTLQEETVRSNQLEEYLQEAQQESERVGIRCQGLELELKQRDGKLEDLLQELEQRGEDLAGCNLRIRTLEEALSAKEPEIQIKVQELCERDRIIEEKQNQIEQQNKVLVEIQITLDEKQRQIETLRSSLAARDSSIADLESRLAKAKAAARNMEAKLDASMHEANRLREEIETLKAQQKRSNHRSRDQLQHELEMIGPLRRRSSNMSSGSSISNASEEKVSPGRRLRPTLEDDSMRRRVLELKEKEENCRVMEQKQKEMKTQLDEAEKKSQSLEEKVKQLEAMCQNTVAKYHEAEKKIRDTDGKSKQIQEEYTKACQAIKSFVKRQKESSREIDLLKGDIKKRERQIQEKTMEVNELRDALNKANWEARQLQAQARVQGGGGMPGAFEDVRDMTEEENERLWAEVEEKNKKLLQLAKERDGISFEMEKQVQALLKSLKEKEDLLADYENKAFTTVKEIESRDNHIKELEEDLKQSKNELNSLKLSGSKSVGKGDEENKTKEISDNKDNKTIPQSENLIIELESNKREVERLNTELQKTTNNLQELVNKELWDKNREIEKLQDRLNNISQRKELEIMSLQQQVGARDFQLKMLQDKVTELGIHVNLPSSLMFRELQQIPVTFNQHVHYSQSSSGDTNEVPKVDISQVSSAISCGKDDEKSLVEQLQASVEERKYLYRKVEELREKLRNTPERDNDSRTLRSECNRLKEEIDKANAWRKEAGEAYALLTNRLEELAGFLSSLLRHPEQLGSLGIKRRQLLKQAMDRNLELSRTLSVSFSINSQDLNNVTFPSLMDSFSSLLLSANDLNLSITDILKTDLDEGEISSNDPGQQDTLVETSSQYCRSSGSNSEIVRILGMKDSSTSDDLFSSADKIGGEQAQIIAHLRSQIETLTQEIKKRDSESYRSHHENPTFTKPDITGNLSGPRSRSSSPSKSSSTSSGTVWKKKNETERLENVEEGKESLNSMVFYNSQHINNKSDEPQNDSSLIPLPVSEKSAVNESKSTHGASPARSSHGKTGIIEARRSASSPLKMVHTEELKSCVTVADAAKSPPKKQDLTKSTKSPSSFKMHRSSSASAVALSLLQQPVQPIEIPPGSHSESEAWSEPDRTVSLARIGLNEESVLPAASVSGCLPVASTRSRSGRIVLDEVDSSESSEETAHEIRTHSSGKRSRSDIGEIRRLQNRLRALEEVNEALRGELTILHQLSPPSSLPSVLLEASEKPATRDICINTTEEKMDKSTSIEPFANGGSSVTVPKHLLEQIRYQREKLELSLFHNDFFRTQLEGIFTSLSSKDDDNMASLWQKLQDTTEQLEEAQRQSQELERRLQEMSTQLQESKEQARLARKANEQLEVTRQTVAILQEQVTSLEARLQEKDNEILEKKCLLLETENQAKQQTLEAENLMQEARKKKEEAENELKTAEAIKLAEENKMLEANKIVMEAEKAKADADDKIIDLEKRLKDAEVQMKGIEHAKTKLQAEKEALENERGLLIIDREITAKEKEALKKEKDAIDNAKIEVQEEWEKIKTEKENMKKELEESVKQVEILTVNANKQKDDAERKAKEAKKKMQDAEELMEEAERKIKTAEDKIIAIQKQCDAMIEEHTKTTEARLKQKLQEAEKQFEMHEWVNKTEVERKIRETEQFSREFAAGLKSQLEEAEKQGREIRSEAEIRIKEIEAKSKEREAELKKSLQECEKRCREKDCKLMKHLDETTLSTSQAALERIRLANEKLRLEQEISRHEAKEAELVREKKDAENRFLITKEQLEKEMAVLQQQKNDLEKCVKDLETANVELRKRLLSLNIMDHPSSSSFHTEHSGHTSGPDSTSSVAHIKVEETPSGSYSSGLDLLMGERGSHQNSSRGTTGPVSLEYVGNQGEDRDPGRDRSRRGSDGGRSGGLTALSSLILQHGFGRQRSELSDYMSEDQAQEYETVFTQTCSSSYWVTMTEQHSTQADPASIRNINSSPDLGIESDQGRFSSLEAASSGVQMDTTKMISTLEGYGSDMDRNFAPVVVTSHGDASVRSYNELEQENIALRRRLTRTHRALEESQAQLSAANQRKKQVERAICKQLHKTHHILKKARINLDTGSDYLSPSTEEME